MAEGDDRAAVFGDRLVVVGIERECASLLRRLI
jgi:hypothetical protein